MSVGLKKSFNKQECAVKTKHLVSVVNETSTEKGDRKFWTYVEKLPLNKNNILAWKFCHVLHQILSDGHPRALIYAEKKRGTLIDLGHNWSLSQENYADEIQIYTALLDTKLKFHTQFPQFPGNLKIHQDELKKIGGASIALYGEITMSITDYLEQICKLRTSIFKSLRRSKCNSMMHEGQCRLMPIVLCFQDSVRLHDIVMKILQLSPSCLPMKLTNYRDRYREQMKSFHDSFEKAMKYQFLNEKMPEEVRQSHTSLQAPEILEGSEGIAEMVIQTRQLSPQPEVPNRNQKIFNNTISALEQVSQQFVKILSDAKAYLDTASTVGVKEEIAQKNENIRENVQLENIPEEVKVDKIPGKNGARRNDDRKNKKEDAGVKEQATFEKKLDALLERYFAMKLKVERAKLQEKQLQNLTVEDHIRYLLQLIQQSPSSRPTPESRNVTSENTPTAEVPQPNPPKMYESIGDYWDYADVDDTEEYMTILGQRLQKLLDKMYSVRHEFEQFDLSQLTFIDEENSSHKEEQLKTEESLTTDSVKTEDRSESDASSLVVEDDVNDEDIKNENEILIEESNVDEKVTLKTILRQLQKLQEIMIKNQK